MNALANTIIFALALVIMIAGLLSTFLPLVPGVLIIWLGALAYALATDFTAPGPITFTLITLLSLIGATADIWMSFFGAKAGGASLWGMLAGAILGVIGLIIFFPLGGIIGTLIGVAGVELLRSKDIKAALSTGGWTLGGYLLTTVVQLILGILVIAAFLASVLIPLEF